jgi:hypothetical protein
MREIRTEVEIAAPRERVWAVLADFARHAEWNPFIRSIKGELKVGGQLEIRIHPPGGKAMTFEPELIRAVPSEELRWIGRVLLQGIFDGEHIFELKPIDNGERTRFVQREEFRGVLVPFLWRTLNTDTRRGFEEMNQALKERVEVQDESQS